MKKSVFLTFFLPVIFIVSASNSMIGQEKSVLVERCKALDQSSPIYNIWVDPDNIKWVANSNGLNKVLSLDVVEKVTIPAGTTSLLTIRGGNAQLEWNTAEMNQLLGNAVITCGSYNKATNTVWLGTKSSGAFEVSISPLRIVRELNTKNRKLTSNQVNDIFIRSNGNIYIATNDGMLVGSGDKWDLQERYLNFIGVDAWGENMWILGDNFLWQVDGKGKWSPIAIELRNVEGQMRDIAVDDEGRVWIASNMMTGYDVAAEKYQRFGPGQYFTSQFVNCLDVDQDGSIWTGTDDKGLYLIQWESSLILTVSQDKELDCKSSTPSAALSVKVAGGKPPYLYQWSNGNNSDRIDQLSAGAYQVTVTDATGMSKTGKYEIGDPSIRLSINDVKPSASSSQNGSAVVIVEGGSEPYTYIWDNGETGSGAIALPAGDHSVTVTDKAGCVEVATVTIPETITALNVTITPTKEIKCAGESNAELKAEVAGGKSPYKYAWSSNNGNAQIFSSLTAGSYTVTVTDASGQTGAASIIVSSPPPLAATIELLVPASVNMTNGEAKAIASGGTPPYTYQWQNGEVNALNKSLAPGQNVLTVTDANGCTASASLHMTENIPALTVRINADDKIKCHGDQISEIATLVSGGKEPFVYKWNNGSNTPGLQNIKAGKYEVTVTDATGNVSSDAIEIAEPTKLLVTIQSEGAATTDAANGWATAKATGGTGIYDFEWDNGEKSSRAVKLSPGHHSLTVTDGAGCTAKAEIDIYENILALEASIEQTAQIKCAGDASAAIEAKVSGGKKPYAFMWNNNSTTGSLTNIVAELYTVTVTDATGHTATSAIAVDAPAPVEIRLNLDAPASANKSDGRATATVSGGSGSYSYQWDNGERTEKAVKLPAGPHSITVTDDQGCTAIASIEMTEDLLPLSASIVESGKVSCAGQKNMTLSAQVTGGKAPYLYSWSGLDNGSSSSLQNVGAGTYSLKITDVAGNAVELSHEIKEPAPLVLDTENLLPASTGNSDGSVTVKISGGTPPYSFNGKTLSSSTTQITIDNLSPGAHNLVIADAGGCSAETSITIKEEILPLSVTIKETTSLVCAGASNAQLEAVAKGGKTPYEYTWGNGSQGSMLTQVQAGPQSVKVKDASGQEVVAEIVIKSPPALIAQPVNLRAATNDRIHDGKASLEIKGGTSPYTYLWSSGETSATALKLPLGSGNVTVTDQHGCSAVADFIIREKVLPELTSARLASGEPIRMEKIQFQADSINIEADAIPSLDELYEFLYDHPTTIIEVAGHTNGLPADEYCDRISTERAKSVADYLINKGIEPRRVISKGYGKRKPIATNQTPEGRRKNQRVEIRLIKIEE